ncbi:hypothetical protein Ddc_23588 [Ditylenchus destructor]|nr:hypothetical protein Ddc_23588 [Ditylenchus destructor]
MAIVNQKMVDAVKDKLAADFPIQGHMTHSHDYRPLYISCGIFVLPINADSSQVMGDDELDDVLSASLTWLERNVRAYTICLDLYSVDLPAAYRLLINFVFGVSRKCAREEIRLDLYLKNKMLTSFVETFWTLPPIECEIPTVVIDEFQIYDAELNLGPNLIEREVDSQGAEFLYVLENGTNRMRISFCKKHFLIPWNDDFFSNSQDCYIKFYAIQQT